MCGKQGRALPPDCLVELWLAWLSGWVIPIPLADRDGGRTPKVTREMFPGEDLARLRGLPQAVRDELIRCFTLAAADEAFVGESGEQ